MDNDKEILQHLNSITDSEWLDVVDKLTTYVHYKLKGRTLFGAHSEQNLGGNAIDYYVNEAIGKLFSLEWKWQFEKYSLLEQLQRVIGSMISSNIEKFKAQKLYITSMEEDKLISLEKSEINDCELEYYAVFRNALEECSKDDEDLQLYVMALDDCRSFDEMVISTGFEKKKLYVLQKKMTRRVIAYIETNKKLTK